MFSKLFGSLCSLFLLQNIGVYSSTYCYDSYDCSSDTVSDDYILCYGYFGCYDSVVEASQSAYCDGLYGCYSGIISALYSLSCDGSYSCYNSEIASSGNYFYIEGAYAAGYSTLIGASDGGYLAVYGRGALYYSHLSEYDTIWAYGYYSAMYATIDSYNMDNLYVGFYGYYSGYQAVTYCNEGSNCYIYCQGNGCYNTYVICMSNSVCSINCDSDCESCPTVYNITTSNTLTMNEQIMKINEELAPEVRKNALKKNKEMIDAKSQEFISQYGNVEGKQKFEEWNKAFLEEMEKQLPKDPIVAESRQLDTINLNESNGIMTNKLLLYSSLAGILLIGIIIGLTVSKCLNKEKQYSYMQLS